MLRDVLEAMLTDEESDRAERTVSYDKTDKFAEAICAFANDLPNNRQPGYLFVGAKPDGKASGLAVTDRLLQSLAHIRSDGNVQPLPAMQRAEVGFRWWRYGSGRGFAL